MIKTLKKTQRSDVMGTVFRLVCLLSISWALAGCSVGYVDRAIYEDVTPSKREDLKIRLESDTHGVHWYRDGGRATLFLTTKSERPPTIVQIYLRSGVERHEVEFGHVASSLEKDGSIWRLTIPLGILFKHSFEGNFEIRIVLEHQGHQKSVVRRYRVRRDQGWHTFNILLDVT